MIIKRNQVLKDKFQSNKEIAPEALHMIRFNGLVVMYNEDADIAQKKLRLKLVSEDDGYHLVVFPECYLCINTQKLIRAGYHVHITEVSSN